MTASLDDLIATCQNCRLSITQQPGRRWKDATGWELCAGSRYHEPMPAGLPGAPVEVPGRPDEPEPIKVYPQWRLP